MNWTFFWSYRHNDRLELAYDVGRVPMLCKCNRMKIVPKRHKRECGVKGPRVNQEFGEVYATHGPWFKLQTGFGAQLLA